MECALMNLLEKNEKLLVVEIGIWGERAASLGERLGFKIKKIIAPPGKSVNLNNFKKVIVFILLHLNFINPYFFVFVVILHYIFRPLSFF